MNKSDITRDYYMLKGPLKKRGYDWWWHSFTGYNKDTKEEKSFFIEYFVINPAKGGDDIVFGQLDENKANNVMPSYVMIKAGAWGEDAKQLHGFYPINQLEIAKDKLQLKVGECTLAENAMRGEVNVSEIDAKEHPEYMSDSGNMKWDIKIDKKVAFHVGYGASKFFRGLNAFEMFWHAEGMKTEYSGTIILDGAEYDIIPEKSYGYADKNWGGDFTSPWVWLSSCNIVSLKTGKRLNNTVFDIGGGRPKVFGVPLDRKLLSALYYEGKDYEFNFSKFWTFTRTKFNCYETEKHIVWEVTTQNRKTLMDVRIKCPKSEMLLVNYEAPNGTKKHNKLWNGGTGTGVISLYEKRGGKKILIDELEARNIGCEYGEYTEKIDDKVLENAMDKGMC